MTEDNIQSVIEQLEYENEPIITNIASLSGLTCHAVREWLVDYALELMFTTASPSDIADDAERFYNHRKR